MFDMSVFFIASKLFAIFFNPLWQVIFLICAAMLAQLFKARAVSTLLLGTGCILALLYSFLPFSEGLLRPLENYAPKPSQAALAEARGIIVLGGFTGDGKVSASRNAAQLNYRAERFVAAVSLHQKFPDKPVWFSGFSGQLVQKGWSEDVIITRLLADLQLEDAPFYFERKSRNTAQNAKYTYQRIQPNASDKWILVTSASHMKRAHHAFQKAGWQDLILLPVDYQTPQTGSQIKLSPYRSFHNMRLFFHEFFGLLAYKLTRRI